MSVATQELLAPDNTSPVKGRNSGSKYLTFKLGREQFGLEILKVREIMGWINVTPVPMAPAAVKGVLNLRGKIIPVIDLRTKFSMDQVEITDRSCIIVVDVAFNSVSTDIGVVVDSVSEVRNIRHEDIGPAPSLGSDVDTSFILGMAKTNEAVIILLAIENVLSESDYSTAMQIDNHSL